MLNLNLGCGTNNREAEEVGIDISTICEPDVCGDISSLPFKDESFENIKAIHVMEHVDDIVSVMDEAWRVLKRGGKMVVAVPSYPSDEAMADPTHKRYFIPKTFTYFMVKGKLSQLKHLWTANDVIKNQTNELVCILKKVEDA